MGFQVALVPLFLSYWPAKTYGAWLALQAAYALMTLFDGAHQAYLENEFLKRGHHDLPRLRSALYSALPVGVVLSAAQIAILVAADRMGALGFMTGLGAAADRGLREQAFWVLMSWLAAYLLTLSVSGLIGRALSALGYFSRFAWWGLLYVASSTLVPVLVLWRGGDLLQVGIAQAAVTLAYHLPWFWDARRVLRREQVLPVRPSLHVALANLRGAMMVLFRSLLDLSRQQGLRIILAPLVGLQKLAEFSTQRTVANVALQSLNGLYGPLMPEMMRYVRERNQAKVEGAFAVLWGLLIAILCPLVVVLQGVMPVVYPLWTRGKFPYDALLLDMISSSILVYMIALPAMAVCAGNNLVKLQLSIAVVAALVLFGTLPVFTHLLGLRGAALSLLCAEAAAAMLYVRGASNWLRSAGLLWPRRGFGIASCAVVNSVTGMTLVCLFSGITIAVSAACAAASLVLLLRSWRALPDSIRHNVNDPIWRKLQFLRRLLFQ